MGSRPLTGQFASIVNLAKEGKARPADRRTRAPLFTHQISGEKAKAVTPAAAKSVLMFDFMCPLNRTAYGHASAPPSRLVAGTPLRSGIHEAMEKTYEGGLEENRNRKLDRPMCGATIVQQI